MAYPAVTYTFAAGQTAAAAEVNRNFTDIINGLSDGTKDLNVNAITCSTLTPSSSLSVTGSVTCDALRVDASDTTDKIILGVGNSTASSGTFNRDTTWTNNIVSDAGTLTDDGVLVLDDRIDSTYGLGGWGYLTWGSASLGVKSVNFTFTWLADSTVFTLTAAGPDTATFDDADTDEKMCVYVDDNHDLVIKNRTGGTVKISYFLSSCLIDSAS